MTLSQVWSSLPWQARAAGWSLTVVVPAGVLALSLWSGRAVGWLCERLPRVTPGTALAVLLAGAVAVGGLAVGFVEPLREKRRARRFARRLEDARRQADVRAARALLDRTDAQAQRDAAYALAEEQASAMAETGQGWVMPSREQIEAAASDGGHDEVPVSTEEALMFAAIAAGLRREERPRITADTDPDGSTHCW